MQIKFGGVAHLGARVVGCAAPQKKEKWKMKKPENCMNKGFSNIWGCSSPGSPSYRMCNPTEKRDIKI
jgi:hypothetical protein